MFHLRAERENEWHKAYVKLQKRKKKVGVCLYTHVYTYMHEFHSVAGSLLSPLSNYVHSSVTYQLYTFMLYF